MKTTGLTGLEAIEVMKQGKVVKKGDYVYKIKDGKILKRYHFEPNADWSEYIEIDSDASFNIFLLGEELEVDPEQEIQKTPAEKYIIGRLNALKSRIDDMEPVLYGIQKSLYHND